MTHALLQKVWGKLRNLRWLHSAQAGVESLLFPGLVESSVVVTNAKVRYNFCSTKNINCSSVKASAQQCSAAASPMTSVWGARLFCTSCIATEASTLLCASGGCLASDKCPLAHADGCVTAARHSYSTWRVATALKISASVQGNYSHSLAEWALTACNWFAKELPRVRAQQKNKHWGQLYVEELRWVCQAICLHLSRPPG